MLAYAANRPLAAQRHSSPNAMLAIIAAHVAVIALVMNAKMELGPVIKRPPIDIFWVPKPVEPAEEIKPRVEQPARESTPSRTQPEVPLPPTGLDGLDSTSTLPNPGPTIGPSIDPGPRVDPLPMPKPLRFEAKLLTPLSELKPPYPESKLASGEEALLRLRLTVDERGRVVAVEPVGQADRVFLASARRHLMAHWRYKPASEDGRAVTSFEVISLRFQLDG